MRFLLISTNPQNICVLFCVTKRKLLAYVMENVYESDRAVAEYLLFHYGNLKDLLPLGIGHRQDIGFPQKCVDLLIENYSPSLDSSALDLGCAVGRSSFELARFCKRVVGLDFSSKFITAANKLKIAGSLEFARRLEGDLSETVCAEVPQGIDKNRIEFIEGYACHLPVDLGRFDMVLLANLIDRLPDPKLCLEKIADFLIPEGVMVITSPYTWMEEFTPKRNWLGGYKVGDNSIRTLDTLKNLFEKDFIFLKSQDIPFLIYEHERKFQWSISQATVWQRK